MSRRRPYSPRTRAADRRAIVAQAMQRTLLAAEHHRDLARAGIAKLEGQIAEREELGLSVEAAMAHLARLRISIAAAEVDIAAARQSIGRDRAA